MSAPRDKFGRPIVVVTGMGVVTSLGAGKAGQLAQTDRGRVRHPHRDPLSDRWSENDHGGHGRFRHRRSVFLDRPGRTACRNCRPKKRSSRPPSAARRIFQDRCFLRSPRSRSSGRSGSRSDAPIGKTEFDYERYAACQRRRAVRSISSPLHVRLRGRATSPKPSAPRDRRSRSQPPALPAQPRSSSASRRSAAAKPTPRCA